MASKRRHDLLGLLAAGPLAVAVYPACNEPSSVVTQTLAIGGRVQNRLDLSVEALAGFPPQAPAELALRGCNGQTLRIHKGYTGAKLTDLPDKAILAAADPKDLQKTIVVATASDGYQAVFSWSGLYNTSVGEVALVLYAKEGKPLGDEAGRIDLISTRDLHAGARHVPLVQARSGPENKRATMNPSMPCPVSNASLPRPVPLATASDRHAHHHMASLEQGRGRRARQQSHPGWLDHGNGHDLAAAGGGDLDLSVDGAFGDGSDFAAENISCTDSRFEIPWGEVVKTHFRKGWPMMRKSVTCLQAQRRKNSTLAHSRHVQN